VNKEEHTKRAGSRQIKNYVPHPHILHAHICKWVVQISVTGFLLTTGVQTTKWPFRFNYLLDVAIINSWLMYSCTCEVAGFSKKEQLPLISYSTDLPTSMINLSVLLIVSHRS
jgi:hypothetical protein